MGNRLAPILIIISLLKLSHQDKVEQLDPEISVKEESSVTLTSTLKTSDSIPYVYWYSQQPGKAPVYMFQLIGENVQRNTDLNDRFSSNFYKSNKTTELRISNTLISDSAVYFCALKPTLLFRYKRIPYKNPQWQFQLVPSREHSHMMLFQFPQREWQRDSYHCNKTQHFETGVQLHSDIS